MNYMDRCDWYAELGCTCLDCGTCYETVGELAPGQCPSCELHRLYSRDDRWRAERYYREQLTRDRA